MLFVGLLARLCGATPLHGYQPPFALVVYGCHKENLHWIASLPRDTPVFHVGCTSLRASGYEQWRGCDESHGYLEWVIDNYERLASGWPAENILFMHAHGTSWHYTTEASIQYGKLLAARAYVEANEFGGLYCHFNKGYAPSGWDYSKRIPLATTWNEIFRDTGIGPPDSFLYPCCGTFWVRARALAGNRRKSTYQQVLANVFNTTADRNRLHICGRVTESAWHLLFGNVTAVALPPYCPEPTTTTPPPPTTTTKATKIIYTTRTKRYPLAQYERVNGRAPAVAGPPSPLAARTRE